MRPPAGRTHVDHVSDPTGWRRSPQFRCLDFEWSAAGNEPELIDRVTTLYEPCVHGTPGPAGHEFVLRQEPDASVSVSRDGDEVLAGAPASLAMARLAWEVNRGVVEERGDRLLLHAAAAERGDRIVVIAGPEGSGKSTLVTALLCSGLRYVTDETVAVRPGASIAPYPKPISLPADSLVALRDLCPALPPGPAASGEELIPAQLFRQDAVASGGTARLLLLLSTFCPGRATAVRPVARAEAVTALAEHTFNLRTFGPGGLDVLAGMVSECACYRLDIGDLDAARRLVLELFDRPVT
jgi:hypothetical protein